MMFGEHLLVARKRKGFTLEQLAEAYNKRFDGGLSKGTLSKYENGKQEPMISTVGNLASILNVSVDFLLYGNESFNDNSKLTYPTITDDCVVLPVIGDIAAGYEMIAFEDWDGETVAIPGTYLKGRKKEDFFVLTVKGDSMYPLYHDGDKVLVLKQSTLNHSGQIGAVIYNDEMTTLKKVEYVNGENWLRLIPINPEYKPRKIENEELEHCHVIGTPKLLIREL